jgi:hypothetical protein
MTSRILAACAGLLVMLAAPRLSAQDPVRLPGVAVTAERAPPGPRLIVGKVRDTTGADIEGVEISIPSLQRRTSSRVDGAFRFDSIPRGKYSMRARKFGYAPQVREFVIGSDGGRADFDLVPLPHSLPAVITHVARGGLSGVVADTSYRGVPAAMVQLNSRAMRTTTDSNGAFFIDARPGHYMISITRPGYRDKVVSVTVPQDSGRHVSVMIRPFEGKVPVREAWNVFDMGKRIDARNSLRDVFYTHEDMVKLGFEWAHEVMREGGQGAYDPDCEAMVDGGPLTRALNTLTVDELEGMEIYNSARGGGRPASRSMARTRAARQRGASRINPNEDRAAFANQAMFCPTVWVWLR